MVTGTVNQNVEPTSGVDRTPIFPPIKLTSCLDIASPRPVPPNGRVEELSACWKGTNNKSMSLCERPIPVSLWRYVCGWNLPLLDYEFAYWISNVNTTFSALKLDALFTEHTTFTEPFAVNLTAFPTKFIMTGNCDWAWKHEWYYCGPTLANTTWICRHPLKINIL